MSSIFCIVLLLGLIWNLPLYSSTRYEVVINQGVGISEELSMSGQKTVAVNQEPDSTKGVSYRVENVIVKQYRPEYPYEGPVLIAEAETHNTMMNIGLNHTKHKLAGINQNYMSNVSYISLSNSTDSIVATWTELPDEITTGAMGRTGCILQDYVSTPQGKWNCTNTFSPSEQNSTRLAGANWESAGDGNLFCAAAITPVINYDSGDTVIITWIYTVSLLQTLVRFLGLGIPTV